MQLYGLKMALQHVSAGVTYYVRRAIIMLFWHIRYTFEAEEGMKQI